MTVNNNHGYKNITEYLHLIYVVTGLEKSSSYSIIYEDTILPSNSLHSYERGKASIITSLDIKEEEVVADRFFSIPRRLKAYLNDKYHYSNGRSEYDETHCIWFQKESYTGSWDGRSNCRGGNPSPTGLREQFKYKAIKYAKYPKFQMLEAVEELKATCKKEKGIEELTIEEMWDSIPF